MKQRYMLITLSLVLLLLGLPLLNPIITGAATVEDGLTFTNPVLGLLFLMIATILFISSRKLEDILSKEGISLKDLKKNKDRFIKNHFVAYKSFLEKERKLPKDLKSEKEKFDYAKEQLKKKFEPLTEYNDKSAIEYIEHFGHSPERRDFKVIDPNSKNLKIRVNHAVKNNCFINLTEKAKKDKRMWKAAEAQMFRFSEGNLGNIGRDYRFVENTNNKFLYLKSTKSGARIFLKKIKDNEFDFIGVASGQQKKKEENKAIEKCQELYQKK